MPKLVAAAGMEAGDVSATSDGFIGRSVVEKGWLVGWPLVVFWKVDELPLKSRIVIDVAGRVTCRGHPNGLKAALLVLSHHRA